MIPLSQEIMAVTAVLMFIVAFFAFLLSYKAYKNTKWHEIAKQKDLEETNKKVMEHDNKIHCIEKDTASTDYVDKQNNALHSRVSRIEERMDSGISEVRKTVNTIHEILIQMNK